MSLEWHDPIWSILVLLVMGAVFVVSYRRCRVLSGYPVWRSVLTGLLSAWFWPVWLVLSGINAGHVMREWDEVRARRRGDPVTR